MIHNSGLSGLFFNLAVALIVSLYHLHNLWLCNTSLESAAWNVCEEHGDEPILDFFCKATVIACRSARLGIFAMECLHRQNRALAEASFHLGSSKNFVKLSAESFLATTRHAHELLQQKQDRQALGQSTLV